MTSSTLEFLPGELTDLILHFIDNRGTIYALSLTSRDLNRIATPHLYTTITLTRTSYPYLRPLALLLWTSPKHRAIVRSLSVRRAYGGNLVPWPDHPGLDEIIEEQVKMYVKESERINWIKEIRYEDQATRVASLLLRSLPGVDRMEFDGFSLVDPRGREEMGS